MKGTIKTEQDIEYMRQGGAMLAQILELLVSRTTPGISPKELSKIAAIELKRLGGEPAFKGYGGGLGCPPYPDIICISVNNQVQHGIPVSEQLEEGDIVNYDFGVRYRGLITDAGLTVAVGESSPAARRLLSATHQALEAGLQQVRAGCHVGDISAAIERVLRQAKLGIVEDLVGHGVGYDLHEDPNIPNHGRAGSGPRLEAGMTIAIEPIANLGSGKILLDPDGWTLWSADGSWSAQFERTVLVTSSGFEVLTPWRLADT